MRPALVPILLADPLPWAKKADYAWDFLRDRARFAGGYKGALANTPNWTFTRASTAYYTNSAGVLLSFASGALRYGDRGALIEGAGTNLCLQSQTFDNASWTKNQSSVSANATTAPDGTSTADLLTEDSTAGAMHRATQSPTTTAAAHTASVYVKPNGRTWVYVRMTDNTSTPRRCYFNCSGSGSVGTAESGITGTITALANGWYRVSATIATALAGSNFLVLGLSSADNTETYNGDGASGIYVWGAQLEAASFPSSYIPTTTASATRAADSLTVTGVSGLDYPLTLYAEFERGVDTGTFESLLYVRKSTTDLCALYIGSSDVCTVTATSSSATQGSPSVAGAIAAGTTKKLVGRIATNDMRPAMNGTLGTQDTSVTLPALAPDTLDFAHYSGGTQLNNYLRRLAIFSRALSDAELQAMTT